MSLLLDIVVYFSINEVDHNFLHSWIVSEGNSECRNMSAEQRKSLKWISVKRNRGTDEIVVNKKVKDEVRQINQCLSCRYIEYYIYYWSVVLLVFYSHSRCAGLWGMCQREVQFGVYFWCRSTGKELYDVRIKRLRVLLLLRIDSVTLPLLNYFFFLAVYYLRIFLQELLGGYNGFV